MNKPFLTEEETIIAYYAPLEPQFKDSIHVHSEVRLSWKERILLLFRPLLIRSRIDTENEAGRVRSVTRAFAARWRWPWQHTGAYALKEDEA